ncbi:succinate dehydrogenase/fumarate reductase iron-sulfur subunit [Rubrobacter taiwanensis]|jgi:succinate dehydrogenase / fumarate reductase iron-sulfur subunit|uniref:Succinate dehydrogenase/fumarate reductase iron-sulfur subunit n=1 Tax=Rubrobacter taiwanensis TaxID=185139 RepID=A0A4R1BFG6_9ACTN|nr:succinate dehydrogenase/fumarate reductase iron-sulfur subunit [Rubrobacter taiwanensis]TCJ15900.1 succinate dehydrogenase/fumarate reductase iron-sulfur subunit [Rubrobacter taiwanensis]
MESSQHRGASPETQKTVRINIYRGDAEGGEFVEYDVPLVEGMVVLDAVLYVQAHISPDLAVRWNCKAAHCGSCGGEVNGRPKLLCKTRVDDYEGEEIRVSPMRAFPLIKDLVTDVSWNYEVARSIPEFKPAEKAPFTMYEEDVERLYEPKRCIECFLCQDVCHVLRSHHKHPAFAGPRFFAKIQSLEMHPMDTGHRTEYLKEGRGGIGFCNITKCCTEVCPEHINITDNSIIPLKERVVGDYYDPAKWLMRKIRGRRNGE